MLTDVVFDEAPRRSTLMMQPEYDAIGALLVLTVDFDE